MEVLGGTKAVTIPTSMGGTVTMAGVTTGVLGMTVLTLITTRMLR